MNSHIIAENIAYVCDSLTVREQRNIFRDDLKFSNLKLSSLYLLQLSDDSFENSNKTPGQLKREVKNKDILPWWITADDFEDGGKYC